VSVAKVHKSVPGAKRPFVFDLPTFVIVKGGEYQFVPVLNALKGIIEQAIQSYQTGKLAPPAGHLPSQCAALCRAMSAAE
jgi:hypothetical protein